MIGKIELLPNELYRGRARSDTLGQPPYQWDLTSYNGNGECRCRDFETRRLKNLKEGYPRGVLTRCKHLRRARDYVIDFIIAGHLKKLRDQNKNSRPNAPHNRDEGDSE